MIFFIAILLLVFSFDLTRIRKQHEKVIEQNERVISLLEEIKDR